MYTDNDENSDKNQRSTGKTENNENLAVHLKEKIVVLQDQAGITLRHASLVYCDAGVGPHVLTHDVPDAEAGGSPRERVLWVS